MPTNNDLAGQLAGGETPPPQINSTLFSYAYGNNILGSEMPIAGTKSLFNEYALFRIYAAPDFNTLYDRNGKEGLTSTESRNPSATNIINWFHTNAAVITPYSYADFLYCKYYAKIPNNYMITLRRYPFPMLDNLQTSVVGRKIPPIAQAVTWMGEEPANKLSEIMRFACGLNWKEIEASIQNVTGNEKGFESGPAGSAPGANILAGVQGFLNPKEYSGLARTETDYAKEIYGSEGPYANKVYGPVNAITKTKARDMGLHFDQDITLNFHYELKSISNINPKAAMLDILSNMLTLTYNNAKFWGGAIRYFPQHPNVPFFGDQNDFYSGNVDKYLDSVASKFSQIGDELTKAFSNLLSNPVEAIQQLLKGGASFLQGKIAAKDRPQILAIRSLLTGAPVGEWHLVVGNPMNPIAMIGNLICEDMEVEFGDKLGADDFPTEIKFTIKLKHGKPRDSSDIQSMFNLGNGRLYYGINDDAIFSSAHNSVVDTSGTKGEVLNNTALGQKGFSSGDNKQFQLTPTDIAEQNSLNSNISSMKDGKTMWGKKFEAFELQIGKKWSGGAPKTEK